MLHQLIHNTFMLICRLGFARLLPITTDRLAEAIEDCCTTRCASN